ncbi:hypothetical protein M011DRAFT_403650 [Sporormia fimetaria CBS 119925]|uniref:Uncharacterized protein n=1 Tax=Sporormia fimetaria CBS 119925 TaxID=1340428 RepID=A0A6A6V8N6_9PLEO|nr:hypothetical protein M011DRAFT_403650 [Sporormia fimetaria CBS 119925]
MCIRVELLDIKLHRLGSTLNDDLAAWIARKQALEVQASEQQIIRAPRTILLTQDLGALLVVEVTEYVPEEGDPLSYDWTDTEGNPRKLKMPPYCISNTSQAMSNMVDYINLSGHAYIEQLLAGANSITQKTFQAALNYVTFNQGSMVSDALKLWSATRLTERTWRICNSHVLGLEPSTEPDNPWCGIVPVTPIMDTQLDELAIRTLLLPLSERVLKGLKAKIEENRKADWYEIYLTVFILLSDIEYILSDVVEYAARHGLQVLSLSAGYMHACKTLLAYFHFVCQGSKPFQTGWSSPGASNGFTSAELAYIHDLQEELTRQEQTLRDLQYKPMYGKELYWCFQALSASWRADQPHMGPVYGFTEEDFLTS